METFDGAIEEALDNMRKQSKRQLYEEKFQEVVKGECGASTSVVATRLCERRLRILVQGVRSQKGTATQRERNTRTRVGH